MPIRDALLGLSAASGTRQPLTGFQTGSGQAVVLQKCHKSHALCHIWFKRAHFATDTTCASLVMGKWRHLCDDPVCPDPVRKLSSLGRRPDASRSPHGRGEAGMQPSVAVPRVQPSAAVKQPPEWALRDSGERRDGTIPVACDLLGRAAPYHVALR